jgi:hypothetical protein
VIVVTLVGAIQITLAVYVYTVTCPREFLLKALKKTKIIREATVLQQRKFLFITGSLQLKMLCNS